MAKGKNHGQMNLNEAEKTISELGAKFKKRMDELKMMALEMRFELNEEMAEKHENVKKELAEICRKRAEIIEKKKRDMVELQAMMQRIKTHNWPAQASSKCWENRKGF